MIILFKNKSYLGFIVLKGLNFKDIFGLTLEGKSYLNKNLFFSLIFHHNYTITNKTHTMILQVNVLVVAVFYLKKLHLILKDIVLIQIWLN